MQILPGGEFQISGMTAKNMILLAYGIRDRQLIGGPNWLDSETYAVQAKLAGSAVPSAQLLADHKLRLQTVLEDRFRLMVHRETRDLPVHVLHIAPGGLKMQRVLPGVSSENGASIVPWSLFISTLTGWLQTPVSDLTGITGDYYVKLRFTSFAGEQRGIGVQIDPRSPSAEAGPSIYTAVQEQLGLKLASSKAPVEVMLIDRIERPSAN